MAWKFTGDTPIYIQIMDEIKLRIAKGQLPPGTKVPAVRELAVKAGVNPNTMQKALAELEREGVLYSNRTEGRYVANQEEIGMELKLENLGKFAEDFVKKSRALGVDDEAIKQALESKLK